MVDSLAQVDQPWIEQLEDFVHEIDLSSATVFQREF